MGKQLDLYSFVKSQIEEINNESPSIDKIFKSTLIAYLANLTMRDSLGREFKDIYNNVIFGSDLLGLNFGNSEKVFEEYASFIKRAFILDVWGVIENYIRDAVEEIGLEVRSKSQSIKLLIEIIESEIDKPSEKCAKALKDLKSDLNDSFIEFIRIRDALFKKIFNKKEREDYKRFLSIINKMRNAHHRGYKLDQTIDIKSKFLAKSFVKGDSVTICPNEIKQIILGVRELFTKIEAYKTAL